MNLKIKILSILLAVLACLSLASCNKSKGEDGDNTPGDDFTGDISKDDGKDDENNDTPPIDEGDPDKVTTITSASQLREMKRKGTYILGADIDLSGEASWTPVGTYGAPFEGTFDGAGYKITGIKIDSAKSDSGEALSYKYLYYGFFGAAKGATIKNVTFENASITANTNEVYTIVYAGFIAGIATDTTVSNCSVSGSINAVSSNSIAVAGGIIGAADNSVLKSCNSKATVKTESSPIRAVSGGLLGYSRLGTKLEKCSSNGSVTASSTIGIAYAGGIAGYCYTTEMTLCFSDSKIRAEVTGSSPQSGAKGAAHAGGITAVSAAPSPKKLSVFTKCYSSNAEITAYSVENSVYVSGISTETDYSKFIDCYSYAVLKAESVNASASGSGLFGTISDTCEIQRSFFSGSIKLDSPQISAGTLAYSTLKTSTSNENDTDNTFDGSKVFKSVYYRLDTVFTLNGKEYNKGENKDILVQGESRQSVNFLSHAILCNTMGWESSEWFMENEMIYPVIPNE